MTDWAALRTLDGGLGMLADSALPRPDPNPLWGSRLVRDAPDVLKRLHLEFLEAGSNVIETNSYQLSVSKVAEVYGLSIEDAADVLTESVRLARAAVEEFEKRKTEDERPRPLIAASIGPYGASLGNLSEYHGRYADSMSVEQLMDWHRPQLVAFDASKACDLFAFDTVPCLKEAEAIVRLLREFPSRRAWLSFVSVNGKTTCRGEPLAQVAEVVARSEAVVALGLNCGLSPRLVGGALRELGAGAKDGKFLVAFPNPGQRWSAESGNFEKDPLCTKSIAEYVPEWVALGCRWIGGCCGCEPPEIAKIAGAIRCERAKLA